MRRRKKDTAEDCSKNSKTGKTGGVLSDIGKAAGRNARITAHNGFIALIYGIAMFLAFYIALQIAFYGVAYMSGMTGSYTMETPADVLTVYVILIMVCGADLWVLFKCCGALGRAMCRRFWKTDKNGEIDKGAAWRERHAGEED